MTDRAISSAPGNRIGAWLLIAGIPAIFVIAFGYVGGWLAPQRLTPTRIDDQFQKDAGIFPGYRRNHAKGVCISGYFESNGQAAPYSVAQVFAPGQHTQVLGRFSIPGPNPYAPDASGPVRSMALRFALADGQQWRTAMLNSPVFVVSTPQAFYDQLVSGQPDPSTGKPDPSKAAAFFASHPETETFITWAKTTKPSASYVTDSYNSLNAFELVGADGKRRAARWRMMPEAVATGDESASSNDPGYLATDLSQRLAQAPLHWKLVITLANPGDPTNDATKEWPADRQTLDAGTLIVESAEPQEAGPCRDINFDPLILPDGIEASDDPLLPARSATYADSYLRRTSEEAHLPGSAQTHETPQQEAKP